MNPGERIIYTQTRHAGSAAAYITITVLIGIIGGVCAYGISVGLEAKIIGVFCAMPLVLGLFFWKFVKHDNPGKLVVSNKRLYRCDVEGKILEEVSLDEIGALLTSRSTLSVFKKTSSGWTSTFFHGVKDPRELGDAVAGFRLEDSPTQEHTSRRADLRKLFWVGIWALFLQIIMAGIWAVVGNKELQNITTWTIACTTAYVLTALAHLALFRHSTVLEVHRQGKNMKLQMLAKQTVLYIMGDTCHPKTAAQGKNLRFWTGINELDGKQGYLISGGRKSSLGAQERLET
jgi:hypothetical protein